MKKVLFTVIAIGLFSLTTLAQKGSFKLGVGAEVLLPNGDFNTFSKTGIGGSVKAMYGITKNGQITLTSGYQAFGAKDLFKDLLSADKITSSFIPVFAGYRHSFKGLYLEPQVGYSIFKSKIKGGDFESSNSEGSFAWAAGIGYVFRGFDVGIRYQSAENDGSSVALIGIRVGYNISL